MHLACVLPLQTLWIVDTLRLYTVKCHLCDWIVDTLRLSPLRRFCLLVVGTLRLYFSTTCHRTRVAEKGKEASFRNAQMREVGRAQIQIAQCITKTGAPPGKTALKQAPRRKWLSPRARNRARALTAERSSTVGAVCQVLRPPGIFSSLVVLDRAQGETAR